MISSVFLGLQQPQAASWFLEPSARPMSAHPLGLCLPPPPLVLTSDCITTTISTVKVLLCDQSPLALHSLPPVTLPQQPSTAPAPPLTQLDSPHTFLHPPASPAPLHGPDLSR